MSPARPAPVPAPPPVKAVAPVAPAQAPQRSVFKDMAATAAGVAVGSAVGHTVGSAVTGMFSGSSRQEVQTTPEQQYDQYRGTEPTGPCAFEIKQFLKCAQDQSDLSLCEGFNEALRQCKVQNNLK